MRKILGLIAAAGTLLAASGAEACFTVVNGQIVFNGGLTPPGCNGLPNAFPSLVQAQVFASAVQSVTRSFTLTTPTTPGGGGSPGGNAGPATAPAAGPPVDDTFRHRAGGQDLGAVAIRAIYADALYRFVQSPQGNQIGVQREEARDRFFRLRRSDTATAAEKEQARVDLEQFEARFDEAKQNSPEWKEAEAKVRVIQESEGITPGSPYRTLEAEREASRASGDPAAKATQQAIDKPIDGSGNSILDELPEMMGPIS